MTRTLLYVALVLFVPPLLLLAAGQLGLLAGKRPADLGVRDGRLKPPPDTPNCVSSQAGGGHAAIEPLRYTGDGRAAFARLAGVVRAMAGAAIVIEREDYLHAEFTTRLMRFVDDLELYLDPIEGVIHVRSASRIGHGDLGANRARVEAIRSRFQGH